jgi:predicted Zn-dependent peptidase
MPAGPVAKSGDPEARMEEEFVVLMQIDGNAHAVAVLPSLITVVGDIDTDAVLDQLEMAFGELKSAAVGKTRGETQSRPFSNEDVSVSLGQPVAQAQLGYFVEAPGPADPRSDAWRLLLYVLSHDYEGRLGKKAISDAGLAYYIGSEYRSDGINAWISLSAGVDPNKIEALRELLHTELARLHREPPSNAELAEAKDNRLGRAVSSAQSNAELATELAREWLWYGELPSIANLRLRLQSISRQDIVNEIPLFTSGTTIVVAK